MTKKYSFKLKIYKKNTKKICVKLINKIILNYFKNKNKHKSLIYKINFKNI